MAQSDAEAAQQIEFIETDGEYLQLEGGSDGEAGEPEDHWEPASVRQLLALYLQHRDKFRNPKVRKKNVWCDIASLLGKTPDACDKKFRNLKQTYVRLLKKKKRTGRAEFKWPYFETFEEIYVSDGRYHLEMELKLLEESGEPELPCPSKRDPDETTEVPRERRSCRKRAADFRGVAAEMRERQRNVEGKLDRLIAVVEESNNIQRERNTLFRRFLERMNHDV